MPAEPPHLPPRLADPTPVIAIGMALWLLLALGLLAARVVADRPLDEWFWASLWGLALGVLGYSLFRWQRASARRGSRGAQQGL